MSKVLPLFPAADDPADLPQPRREPVQTFPTRNVSQHDPLIKLRDVESVLRQYFDEGSCPSRSTIIGWIEEGTLDGQQIGTGRNYYVYKSSLEKFKATLAPMSLAA